MSATTRRDTVPPVSESVRRWAQRTPGALALVDAGTVPPRTWTWRELSGQADAVAAALQGLGVAPADPVAVKLPNWGTAVVVSLAVARAGAACCFLPARLGARETALAIEAAGARVLFAQARAGAGEHEIVVDPGTSWAPARAGGHAGDRAGPVAPRAWGGQLALTSGTTGQPKLVRHPDGVLTLATRLAASRLGVTGADRVFVPCPLGHHSGFLYGMWLAWAHGCPQVLRERWEATAALAALRRWRCTYTQVAPPHLHDLVEAVEAGEQPPPHLRVCVVTGAPVTQRLADRASRVLGATVCRAWGSTETCMATLASPLDAPGVRCGTDGRPLDGVRVRVTGGDGRTLGAGETGRLEVTGPCVFRGYGAAPAIGRAANGLPRTGAPATDGRAFTQDGWYRSEDLATIDGSGHVTVIGRVGDVVNRGGVKVPSGLVERLLAEHPAVAEVAVTGVRDARLGERPCAFVALTPGHDLGLDDVRRHLAARGVTRHYWPEHLEVVPSLPRNHAGKVRKSELRRGVTHAR